MPQKEKVSAALKIFLKEILGKKHKHGKLLGNTETRDVLCRSFTSRMDLAYAIRSCIHYYNFGRLQQKLSVMTPDEYHEHYRDAQENQLIQTDEL
ncbi:MAG: hypothetical protein VB133_08780 [Anaeromusa sp.]|uniref:IS3 family transposase n=1 Tax=Anaeromusa sp. TaxID=1872520 RepID=UPI002B1F2516|nr:IS3 family transposase [Anaeromusa sp.]MEA4835216.1 hypothetical protein [Anaeromusa sp.]